MSTTTGGLPYPESTADKNQGANDIKALALALESRGHGLRQESRFVSGVSCVNGVATLTFAVPFTAAPTSFMWQPGWPFGEENRAFCYGLRSISATAATLLCYMVSGPAPSPAWYTGAMDVRYIAVGA